MAVSQRCGFVRTHKPRRPNTLAVKVLMAKEIDNPCAELDMAKLLGEVLSKADAAQQRICLPLDQFQLQGPNGTHICIVYPVLGPPVNLYMKIFGEELKGADCARGVRRLLRKVVEALSILHKHNICHGGGLPSK